MVIQNLRNALRDGSEVALTVVGRRSGRESTRPVTFIEDCKILYLIPVEGSGSNWYRNVVTTPRIRLAVDDVETVASAEPIEDPEHVARIFDRFRAKYGGGNRPARHQDRRCSPRLAPPGSWVIVQAGAGSTARSAELSAR